MTAPKCNCGVALTEIPIWSLTREQRGAMTDQQQRWVGDHLTDLEKTGSLDTILANPRGTLFETVIEPKRGWKLVPVDVAELYRQIIVLQGALDLANLRLAQAIR